MKKINLIYGILFLCCFSSCSNWLDVDLVNEVEESKLFKSEQGFREALAGVYSKMSKEEMYGFQWTFGAMDVLAQTYDYIGMYNKYKQLCDYEYKVDDAKKIIDAMWGNGYATIAMINNLLTWEEKQGNVMKDESRKQIKGEAMALRAYIHFDLWRLFAPDIKQDAKVARLPYNRVFGVGIPPLCSSEEFLNHCLEDLEEALKLLENDPIKGVTPYQLDGSNKNQSDLYVARMNYYGIKALMARIYLTRGTQADLLKARTLAQEVIDSKKFALLNYTKSFPENRDQWDVLFSDEHIFSLRNPKIKEYSKDNNYVASGPTPTGNLQMYSGYLSEVYDGNNNDIRGARWVDGVKLAKYYMSDNNNKVFSPKVPMIKLSEMYLIIAESWMAEDPTKARIEVENLRKSRFLSDGDDYKLSQFNAEILLAEMRREYLCEGQMFFTYKRLNHAILRRSTPKGDVPASNAVFVLPIPEKELENGNRNL